MGPQSIFALVLTLSTTLKTIPKSMLVDRQKSGNPAREGRLACGRNPPVLRDPPDTLKSDASPMQRHACILCIQRCSKKLSAKLCQALGSVSQRLCPPSQNRGLHPSRPAALHWTRAEDRAALSMACGGRRARPSHQVQGDLRRAARPLCVF